MILPVQLRLTGQAEDTFHCRHASLETRGQDDMQSCKKTLRPVPEFVAL